MACSLETRSPLLDVELVELAASIPGRFKFNRGRPKHIFKAALRGTVPPDLLDKPKQGFTLPLRSWFRGGLRDALLDTLDSRRLHDGGLFRPQAVQRLVDEHMAGHRDHRKPLFALFMFERWREHWLEAPVEPAARLAA